MNLANMYEDMFIDQFKLINEICVKHGYAPLYENPDDVFASYEYHLYIVYYRKESECNEIMKCDSYDNYVSDRKLK